MAAFQDADQRQMLIEEAERMSPLWDTLLLRQVTSDANQKYVGLTLAEIAEIRGSSSLDAMIDLSIEEDLDVDEVAIRNGYVSITPLSFELTSQKYLENNLSKGFFDFEK